jgi:hypothetical protein
MRCPRCYKTHYTSRENPCAHCGMIPNAFVLKAVARVEESKASHERWAEFLTKHPEEHQRYAETIQTKQEHQRIIREYEDVLRCLRSLLPRTALESRAPTKLPENGIFSGDLTPAAASSGEPING